MRGGGGHVEGSIASLVFIRFAVLIGAVIDSLGFTDDINRICLLNLFRCGHFSISVGNPQLSHPQTG